MPHSFAILPCAGVGKRMGATVPKFLLDLGGISVLGLTLKQLHACAAIDQVVLAISPEYLDEFATEILPGLPHEKVSCLVEGGSERQHSIWHALQAMKGGAHALRTITPKNVPALHNAQDNDLVAVHDAVRPFATPAQFSAVLNEAGQSGAAILAIPAQDTIKEVSEGKIARTVPREKLFQAQTPQAARFALLYDAYAQAHAARRLGTDDASLLEALGIGVRIVLGHKNNLKITTPEDLLIAKTLWKMDQKS